MDMNWLMLGGVEIVNTARVQAYTVGGCGGAQVGCSCPGLAQAIEGDDDFPGYGQDPVSDGAPWVDPAVPESADFLGIVGLDGEGLSVGTASRTPVDLALGGANIGALRHRRREFTIKVTLVARSQAGLSYGSAWLASQLEGDDDCWGSEACLFAWCPSTAAEGDRAVRHLYDTGLLEGPTPTALFKASEEVWYQATEFVLVAGNSYLYSDPYIELDHRDGVQDIVRVPPGGIEAECVDAPPCAYDPDCPPPPLPPLPPQPVDPCWPTTGFQAQRTMFSVAPGGVAAAYDTVPIVRVETGDAPLRRLSVRFYANPTGAPCSRFIDRCLACGEANVAYLPAGSVLTLDGRRQRTVLDCSGGRGLALSEPTPFGPNGGLFSWPVISCANGLCVEVLWQRHGAADNVRVNIDMASRQAVI
ncbi:hypothetical protein [Nocardiopsis synnemataformans]|uniref:hypothetical protein n=1 Tax=Nocardiopsis synnemataformans TaxID=61305 RepID=UPI003EBC4E75